MNKQAAFKKSLFCLAAVALIHGSSLLSPVVAAESAGEFSNPRIDMGIVVKDAPRTAEFLTNAIGFKEVRGFSVVPQLGKDIGLLSGQGGDVRVFVLDDGDHATRIKILSFPDAPGQPANQEYIHSTLGMRYLTLYVKDMTKAVERLKQTNVKLLGKTPLDLGGGTYIAVVKDPDGNFVELIGPMKK